MNPALTDATRLARKRLVEEVRLATYLNHPNIARVHGLHETEAALHVIMESVSGRPHIVHGRLTPAASARS
ncbi:hypothetical protein [Pyxidicoccus trucidator]|uniref:hypothetical protein n=1 Tax=Pyxidicoccus trucidator TaxID=2709662 RepID=UPI0013DB18A8|nr:hypothetical protein [Pyxidicoccus trucidator]